MSQAPSTPAGVRAGQSIAAAATLLMIGTLASRVLGLAREQVTSYLFGTGDLVAAFTIADNVHTMLFDLVMSGMMQAALIPVLSEFAAEEKREELRRITGALLMLTLIGVGSVLVVLEVFAPTVVQVMTSLAGGEEARSPETVELTIELVRLILPAILLLSIGTLLMATLYSLQRFTRPALSLSIRNAAIVFCALTLGRTSLGIKALVIGIVLGALLLVLIQLPGLRDAMPKPNFHFRQPAVRRIYWLYLPIFLGLLVNTAALVVDRNLAWRVSTDALGAMRYATTLNQMVLGLVAAAISLAALPALSRHAAAGDETAYRNTLARGLRMVGVLVIPAALGMAVLSWPIVRLLFFHGATDQEGAEAIWLALLAYLPGTLFAAFDQVLIFAWYARQNTKTPQIVGVAAVGVYFVFAFTLTPLLGMVGLVLANSAQFIIHTVVMIVLLRKLLAGERLDQGESRRTLTVCFGVGLVMAGLAGVAALGLNLGLPEASDGFWQIGRNLLIFSLPAMLGAAVYAAGLFWFRVDEAILIQQRLRALLAR